MRAAPPIRVGLIGFGYWGPNLARNLDQMPGADLVAVAELSAEQRALATSLHERVTIFGDSTSLLESGLVDAVVIATPASTHAALATASLEAGLHVLVEKPLATTSADCVALDRLATSQGLTLMVGHTFLYNAAVRWLKSAIDNGDLGDLYYAYTQRLNLGQLRSDVNVFWDLGAHDISILLHLFAEEPISVSAHAHAYGRRGVPEVGFATLGFGEDRTSHIHASWLDPRKVRRVTVVGSSKMVVYDDIDPTATIQVYDRGIDAMPATEHRQPDTHGEHHMRLRSGDVHIPKISYREPLRVELEEFVAAISEKRPPLSDARNGLAVVRVLEAADRSLATDGNRVSVAEGSE